MPLRGTRVIHPAMQASLSAVAGGGMTAVVDLYDPAAKPAPSYNRATGLSTRPVQPPTHAGVAARVQPSSRGQGEATGDAVGQDVITPPYLVAIPHDLTADEGWTVVVRVNPDDPAMVTRRLTVRRVSYATQRLQRDLFCDDE